MSEFSDKLSALIAAEAVAAKNDPERAGAMIERVARALGFTISVIARGDGKAIDTLIMGATTYAHEEAVEKSRFAAFMAKRGVG